jgi:hypothetical protein
MAMLQNPKLAPVVEEMLITATGKTPPFDAGKYMVCKSIEEQTNHQVRTKHFIVHLNNWAIIPGVPGEVGLCLPAQCTDDDIEVVLELIAIKVPQLRNLSISKYSTSDQWPPPKGTVAYRNPFNNEDDRVSIGSDLGVLLFTPAVTFFGLLIALVLFSTCLATYNSRQIEGTNDSRQQWIHTPPEDQDARTTRIPRLPRLAWLEAFSLTGPQGTWTTLWSKQPKRPTDCLNGMRVVSMLFIVLGHTLSESMSIAGFRNEEWIPKTRLSYNAATTQLWTYIFVVGQLTVDTFFMISGFLLSYIGKDRRMPILMGTALRYCRLLPLFGSVMLLYICIMPFLAFGPFSPRFQMDVFSKCPQDWWAELLFINAWYPWYPNFGGCMGWSWYLGVDMTFFVVGLILLNAWKRNRMLGWLLTLMLTGVSIGISIQQVLYWNIGYNITDSTSYGQYTHYIYSRAYLRFPGFAIGLVAPWTLELIERRRLFDNGSVRNALCLLAWVIIIVCIFLPWTNADKYGFAGKACEHFQCWDKGFSLIWIVLSRPIWCLAWLYLALGCYFGYFPILNSVCSASFWTPLSSLTYGCYLIHPAIVKVLAGNASDYYSFSAQDALSRASLNSILAYSSAVILWCLVEKPCATMTNWLVPKKKGNSSRNTTSSGVGNSSRADVEGRPPARANHPVA